MKAWDLLLLVLMAIAASAVVGAVVTLAFLLIRRTGRHLQRPASTAGGSRSPIATSS